MSQVSMSKRIIAGAVALSVLVVAGCAKEDETAPETTASPTSSKAAATSSAVKTSAVSSSVAPTTAVLETSQPAQPTSAMAAPKQDAATEVVQPPLPLPQLAGESNVEPVTQGRPATPEEIQAITDRVKAQESATTMHQYLNTFVDSMCKEVLDQQGGAEAFSLAGLPDVPLNVMPEYATSATKVTDITDVQVAGDRATANVTTVNGAGETVTNTMGFRLEQGGWKICN